MAVNAWNRLIAIGLALVLGPWSELTAAQETKPRVPAGRDPGGIAVCLVGSGLDYRRPEIAHRIARDGEGELIGWDFSDNDAKPFAASDSDSSVARILLAEGQAVRLVLARVGRGRQDQIAAALRFCAQTPSRIVLIVADPGAPLPLAGLAEAGRLLPHLLLVVPSHLLSADGGANETVERGGLISVAPEGSVAAADLVVVSEELASANVVPGERAAARLVALAVRLLEGEPSLDGVGLRLRLLTLVSGQGNAPPSNPKGSRFLGRE